MKKTYKIFIVFFLLLNLVAFAQTGPSDVDNNGSSNLEGADPITIAGPGDEDNTGGSNLEGNDAAPISSNLWVLIVMGLLYSYFQMNRNGRMKKLE